MTTALDKRNMTDEIRAQFNALGFDNDDDRKNALASFEKVDFPASRSEEYKFTPITKLLEKTISWGTPQSLPGNLTFPQSANQIVFLNGRYAPQWSLLKDTQIKISTRHHTFESTNDPFDLLNSAMHVEALQIEVPDHTIVSNPLHIIHYQVAGDQAAIFGRWQCKIGRQSNLSIFEESTKEFSFLNRSASIMVGEESSLQYVMLQNNEAEISVTNTQIHLTNHSRAACFTYTFNGKLIRNNLHMIVDGYDVETHLFGLYMCDQQNLADNHTVVDHRQPNSVSNELYKGIMAGQSKGVFNGKIFVRPQAQKTNAYQTNRNIILGDHASVNTKPQLEIWADDVKCSHGCTTGQLDEEALFYLRSRGISEKTARSMVLFAFASTTFSEIKDEQLRTRIEELVRQKLESIS